MVIQIFNIKELRKLSLIPFSWCLCGKTDNFTDESALP
ncbi:hypothetical protein QFZ20_005211 [Flavobacterium sp. W4I14]|nr:hypothetical protein [Flavobacterium sp. W4I14]